MENIKVCSNCKAEISWDGGSATNGNIYACENECGNYVCVKCISEEELYEKEINENVDGIYGLENIECIKCKNSNGNKGEI